MIQHRRSVQVAPGRQADAIAHGHEMGTNWKQATGVDVRVTIVTTGTLGRMCLFADYESMAAFEAARAKNNSDLAVQRLQETSDQQYREKISPFVPGPTHNEFWRDA